MSEGHLVNRRYFFLGACSVLGGCSANLASRKPRNPRTNVSIFKLASYREDLQRTIKGIFDQHGLNVRSQRVVIKPNLVEFSADQPINTNPLFVAAVAEEMRARGAKEVRIAEGPGHRRTTLDLAASAGYFDAIPRFENAFTDLNLDDTAKVRIATPFSSLSELYLPHTVLGCDLLVSVAKMKTHHWAGATLSMKNLFGVVPGGIYGWPKNVLHWSGIHECIADLHGLFPRQFCLVDGIEAMEGNGPILGTTKHAGLVVGGPDPVGVDATCCRLMGIDPEKLKYLRLAASAGLEEKTFGQLGESIRATRADFKLAPGLGHLRLGASKV